MPNPSTQVTANPEMGHFECDGTDFLLIVCDGVSEGQFPNPEVCQLAAQVLKETKGDAGKACEAVCHRAVEMNSKDNISCMIVMMVGGERQRERGGRETARERRAREGAICRWVSSIYMGKLYLAEVAGCGLDAVCD